MLISTKAKLLLVEKISVDERKQNEKKEWASTGNKVSMLKYTFVTEDKDGFSEKMLFTLKQSTLDASKLEGKICTITLSLTHDEFSRSFNPVKVTLQNVQPAV